jgi:hypothetical protein
MSNRVKLGEKHTALMFISTKCFQRAQEDSINDIINEELRDSIQFVGRCFGKFDMIAEFEEASAKVASYKACNIQERATKMIQEERKSEEHPICSSLVLCNEFLEPGKTERSSIKEFPIRFYSLFVPKNSGINLEEVLAQVKENMRLLFSSSYFTFLLVIAGDTFYNVFDDFTEFRENTKVFFSESSTHVAIDWENEDKPSKDRKINANVLIKLKEGFGDIDDIKEDEFIKSKNKRFGSFDVSLLVEEGTLSEMKKEILELRAQYEKEIAHTSTSLLITEAKNGTC